jgi:uncharacterized repeat protein (TIGR01451 family)
VQLPPNPAQSRKKQVRRAKAALTAASFVVLPATSAFLAGFGTAHAVGGPGSVAGSVYLDANRNSTQDSGEAGVDGITATAYTTVGGVDTPIGSPAVTSGGGLYNINLTNVSAGDAIKVVFTNLGSNTAVSIGGATQTATLGTGSSGGVFTGVANLGVAPATGVVIGDRIWIDTDGNGIQNANESAVPSQLTGISVELLEDGVGVATTLTDGNGYYLFVDSASGVSGPGITAYAGFTAGKKYAVRVNGVSSISSALSGYTNTLATVGAADADSNGIMCGSVTGSGTAPAATTCDPVSAEITLPAGAYSNTTIDFGFVPYDLEIAQVTTTPNVVAGGIASFDVVVTNRGPGPVQGCNIVNLLPAGLTYASPLAAAITATSANAGVVGIDPADASKLRIDCTTSLAVGAQVRFTVNAVVGASVTGPIKNFTYVTPPSTDAAAAETKPLGNPIPTNATDATSTVTLNDSQASVTVSAPAGTASLGDKVWFDTNSNGIQDSGEAPAPGVSVQLLDSTGTLITGRTGTTDTNGMYGFSGLNAGTYSVKFGTLAGFGYTSQNANANGSETTDSDANATTGISDAVTLTAGENNPNVDAGLVSTAPPAGTASLGDKVWIDNNNNGIQDGGDTAAVGVSAALYDATGTNPVGQTTVTDAAGMYGFTGLNAGTYTVKFGKLSGYTYTTQNAAAGTDATDSDANTTSGISDPVTIAVGENNPTVDAGLVLVAGGTTASVGDTVWLDANRDGIFNAGEQGYAGLTVTLYDAAGARVGQPTTTNTQGQYLFSNLAAGNYSVTFSPATGYSFTNGSAGTDSSVDSDADPVTGRTTLFALTDGQALRTIDAGLVVTNADTAWLGNYVWLDSNGNGVQDAGEAGFADVQVTLTNTATGATKSSRTGATGFYNFANLAAGTYTVSFAKPVGYVFTLAKAGNAISQDSDADINTGVTSVIAVGAGSQNDTIDAGLWNPASIGDQVWIDANGNGVQDAAETAGLAGVTVTLYDGTGAALATKTTDANGKYLFGSLKPGTYSVGFTNLAGHTLTAYRTGTDAAKDSDAVEATGRSAAITIISGQNITDLDAGVIPPKSPVATTATNTATTTTTAAPTSTTAVPGTLPPGSVVVVSTPTSSTVAPAATTPTSSIAPSGSAAPSSTLKPGSPATPIATSPGSTEILDATCKINSVVWIDTNGNGIVDAGEQVIPGVTVRVTAGGIVKEAVTDSLGRYSFVGIQCGDVKVEILSGLPAGTPLPPAKTIRVLGETAQAPLDVPFGVQLQTDAEVAFGGAESRQFFAAALTFLGMGGLLMSRKRKEANLRH